MVIEMTSGATDAQINAVIARIQELGFSFQLNQGEVKTVIAVLGENTGAVETGTFEVLDGVEQVVRIQKPFKLASLGFKPERTIVEIGDVKIGGKELVIMAGPCSVESQEQVMACAEVVKKAGGQFLRGGAYKPRTSPFAFQGLEEEGLKILANAREKTGLLVVTEVVSPEHADLVSSYADILQIGARNMQNYPLLKAVAKTHSPVLLKRGLASTVEEWLCAADYILSENGDSPNVILCHRGITTFDKSTRYSYDDGVIPVLRHLTHLPIISDPSHPAGNFHYVPAYAKSAVAMGTDGLIIEIHPDPKTAKSDGAQSLTFSDFERLMADLQILSQCPAISRGN